MGQTNDYHPAPQSRDQLQPIWIPFSDKKKARKTSVSHVHHREILFLSTENVGRFFFLIDPTHFELIIFKFKGIYLLICLKKEDSFFSDWMGKYFLNALFY